MTAEYTGIDALRDVMKLVDNRFNEIPNLFNSGISNGVVEGIDSDIQTVKNHSWGYRDLRNLGTMYYLQGSSLRTMKWPRYHESGRNVVPTRLIEK